MSERDFILLRIRIGNGCDPAEGKNWAADGYN